MCCVLGQDISLSHTVSLATKEYKFNAGEGGGGFDGLASHPGGSTILLVASCYRHQDKFQPDEPLVSYADFKSLPFKEGQQVLIVSSTFFLLQTPWNPRHEMPIEAASVHFLIGMCQSELGRPLGALDAFNNAIRVNPDYAEVTTIYS